MLGVAAAAAAEDRFIVQVVGSGGCMQIFSFGYDNDTIDHHTTSSTQLQKGKKFREREGPWRQNLKFARPRCRHRVGGHLPHETFHSKQPLLISNHMYSPEEFSGGSHFDAVFGSWVSFFKIIDLR